MIDAPVFKFGMHSLCVAFNREATADMRDLYSLALSELTTERFTWAVHEAIRMERFFPPPSVLLEYGREWVPPPALALSAPRTEADREAGRAAAREGLKLLRAAVPSLPPGSPVRDMPHPASPIPGPRFVELSDERRDELRKQAAAITREEGA